MFQTFAVSMRTRIQHVVIRASSYREREIVGACEAVPLPLSIGAVLAPASGDAIGVEALSLALAAPEACALSPGRVCTWSEGEETGSISSPAPFPRA